MFGCKLVLGFNPNYDIDSSVEPSLELGILRKLVNNLSDTVDYDETEKGEIIRNYEELKKFYMAELRIEDESLLDKKLNESDELSECFNEAKRLLKEDFFVMIKSVSYPFSSLINGMFSNLDAKDFSVFVSND